MKAWQKKKIVDACEAWARAGNQISCDGFGIEHEDGTWCGCPMTAVSGLPPRAPNKEIVAAAANALGVSAHCVWGFIAGFDEDEIDGELDDWERFGRECRRWIFPEPLP